MKAVVHTLIVLAIGYAIGVMYPSIGQMAKAKISSVV